MFVSAAAVVMVQGVSIAKVALLTLKVIAALVSPVFATVFSKVLVPHPSFVGLSLPVNRKPGNVSVIVSSMANVCVETVNVNLIDVCTPVNLFASTIVTLSVPSVAAPASTEPRWWSTTRKTTRASERATFISAIYQPANLS